MPLPTLPEILMGLLALICMGVLIGGLQAALTRTPWSAEKQKRLVNITSSLLVLWVVVVAALAQSGVLQQLDAMPPRPLLIVFLPIAFAVVLTFTKCFTTLLKATPLHWLVLFQSFRIVVEILLWQAYELNLIPVQMTFEGRNFDVVTGLLAPVVGFVMWRKPRLLRVVGICFNLVGLALLINIMAVSILSMPTPMRYFTEGIPNTLVVTFPFVYLPAVLVVLAFSFHVFSLRQLLLYPYTVQIQPLPTTHPKTVAAT